MDPAERRNRLKSFVGLDSRAGLKFCKICNAMTSKKLHNVLTHIEGIHVGVQAYQCDYCDQSFKTNVSLLNHVRVKHHVEKTQDDIFANFK